MNIYFGLHNLEQKASTPRFVFANLFLLISSIFFLIYKFGNIFVLETLSTNLKLNIIVATLMLLLNSIIIRIGYTVKILINNKKINPNLFFLILLIFNSMLLSSIIVFLNLDMSRQILYGSTLASALIIPLIMSFNSLND